MPVIEGPKTLEEALKVIRSLKKLVEKVKSQRDCLMWDMDIAESALSNKDDVEEVRSERDALMWDVNIAENALSHRIWLEQDQNL